jgi:hypothetical protein
VRRSVDQLRKFKSRKYRRSEKRMAMVTIHVLHSTAYGGIAAVEAICGPNLVALKVPLFRRQPRFAGRFFHQHSET